MENTAESIVRGLRIVLGGITHCVRTLVRQFDWIYAHDVMQYVTAAISSTKRHMIDGICPCCSLSI